MEDKKDSIFKWTDRLITTFLFFVFLGLVASLVYIHFWGHQDEHGIGVDILVHLACSSGIALITFYFLKPLERLKNDKNNNELSELLTENLMANYDFKKFKGISCIHDHFSQHDFGKKMLKATDIKILNTWIPDLDDLDDYISEAIKNNPATSVKILLLNPNSEIAEIRTKALEDANHHNYSYNVKINIENNLQSLSDLYKKLSPEKKTKIQVRLYNTLPSISFYGADEKQFIGIFFHKKLAIKSPQLEVSHSKTLLGKYFLMEFNTIWDMALPFNDLGNWRDEIGLLT